jgi:hypothetical protein
MPTLTEDAAARLAPDDSTLQNARGLVRKKNYTAPGVSADGTWLLGKCKGSGKEPYEVSVDLADTSSPTFRCNCPSRKFPCKHSLGLLLYYVQSPGQFGKKEPSAELLAKREKKAARAEKKKEEGAAPAGPKKVNVAALAKKTQAQRDGLDHLERLLVDLVTAGEWSEKGRLDKLERQSKQLADAYLGGGAGRRAIVLVRELVLVGRTEGLSDEERNARAADLIGQGWAVVQKGRNYLDGKIAGDESQAEADAVMEDVLGKAWQLTELKEKGYVKADLRLLELAYERTDDEARMERVEISHLLDLTEGAIYQAIAFRPSARLKYVAEQPSYTQPLRVAEAVVYPGFINRRVRWEKGIEQPEEQKPAHLKSAYAAAKADFKSAIEAFKQQMKHPLAPREAVMLLRCERVGHVGDRVVMEDRTGARLLAVDRRSDYSNVANLVRAAGMLNKDHPAVLVRLFLRPAENALVAEPLAALTPQHHLRLGI